MALTQTFAVDSNENVEIVGVVQSKTQDGSGTGITSTLAGSNQALDVYVANAASVKLKDGGGTDLTSTLVSSKQALDVNVVATTSSPVLASTGTLSSVASSASSVSLLSVNASRKGFYLHNDSTQIAYVAFAATATTSAYSIKMLPQSFYEDAPTIFGGAISAIWASANGAMKVTELT